MANTIKTNRSIRLNGINPLAYVGVNPYTPPDYVIYQRDPTPQDWQNFQVGAIWLNQEDPPTTPPVYKVWMLVSLYANKALWIMFANGNGTLISLTGNTGGTVFGDVNQNIFVVGDGIGITITGNPATHTLTASLVGGGTALQRLEARDGTFAVPDATGTILFEDEVIPGSGNIQSNILTSADPNNGHNFVINLTNNVFVPGAVHALLAGNSFVGRQLLLEYDTNNATDTPTVGMLKTRITGGGGGGIVQAGDPTGLVTWAGYDGAIARVTSQITGFVTGVPAVGHIPGNMGFWTSPGNGPLQRMAINSAGNITINAPDSGVAITSISTFGQAIGASGIPVLVDNTGAFGTVASSIKYKDNVKDMASFSSKIFDLRPVIFNYKKHSPDSLSFGLIAEEVAEAFPELAVYKNGEPESVKYLDLIPMLLNEIKKLNNRVTDLENRLLSK